MDNMNKKGVIILIGIFLIFYLITTFFLDRRNLNKNIPEKEEPIVIQDNNYEDEKNIVSNLYNDIKILYDVVNNKFNVSQEDTITIGDIIYKKITNYDEVMDKVFTDNGKEKYLTDLSNYFALTDSGYYLAGNLVNYQTYYFRGDETNIYILSANEEEINGIIYERWTTNNKNTLATIKVIKNEGKWLVDDITILATE